MSETVKKNPQRFLFTRKWQSVAIVFLMVMTICLRLGVIIKLSHELLEDRDAYLRIARDVAAGRGYCDADISKPTAYRPPFYPLVLAFFMSFNAGLLGVAFVNIVSGSVTVWATWRIGNYLKLGDWSLFAALLVAVDPLLLRYASMPMTETFFTMLVTLLFLAITFASSHTAPPSQKTKFGIGLLFGLTALCRPTIWAFGGLMFLAWLGKQLWEWKTTGVSFRSVAQQIPVWILLGIAVVISPWVIRNAISMRSPVIMTTHGGYTLLLGNNPYFWNDVVKKPWGTTWSEQGLLRWQKNVKDALEQENPPLVSEAAVGNWKTRRAIANIKKYPRDFLQASWFRVRRFWNIQPQGNAASRVPRFVLLAIQFYYIFIFAILIIGTYSLFRNKQWNGMPLLLLILSLTIVHTVFWSNARMRIPLVPAISLIGAYGLMQIAILFCKRNPTTA